MKIITCQQYSAEWWSVRRGVPTASMFASIITPKTGKASAGMRAYACQLIADRLDPRYGEQDEYVSAAMKNGTIMEPEARRFYEFQAGSPVQQVGFCMTDDESLGCSPDALVGDDGVLELKSPLLKTHIGWSLDGGLPDEHKCQVHGELLVTGRKWCDFLSYVDGCPPLLVRVVPDDFTAELGKVCRQFVSYYRDLWEKVRASMPAVDEPVTSDKDEVIMF